MNALKDILINMTVCLLLTIAAEGILIYIFTRRTEYIRYSAICNLISNPALNLIMYLFAIYSGAPLTGRYLLLALLEAAAVILEALFYRMLTRRGLLYTLALSLALNAASFMLGIVLLWR